MTQDVLTWRQDLQFKLMAALDAAWAILDRSDDPAEIRRARDKAKAVGELAGMVRKVAMIVPIAKPIAPDSQAKIEQLARVMAPGLAAQALTATLEPGPRTEASQAEHTRRALERLKSGRGRR